MRLTNIIHYDDVETGQLELPTADGTLRWNVAWLADLRCIVRGGRFLPEGDFRLVIDAYERWVTCPMLRLTNHTTMWLVPLKTTKWSNFGVNMYMCDGGDVLAPLSDKAYLNFTEAVVRHDITGISVEGSRQTREGNFLNHRGGQDFDVVLSYGHALRNQTINIYNS